MVKNLKMKLNTVVALIHFLLIKLTAGVELCDMKQQIETVYIVRYGAPSSVWVDPHLSESNLLYVTDTMNSVVIEFNDDTSHNNERVLVGSQLEQEIQNYKVPSKLQHSLNQPWSTLRDSSGNLYISDQSNNQIKKVSIDGDVTVLAGTGYNTGNNGDGGLAINAEIHLPGDMWLSDKGLLYFTSIKEHNVRYIDLNSLTIHTLAGKAELAQLSSGGYGGDGGPASSAVLKQPRGVWGDSCGNILIADSFNNIIRSVDTSTRIISTIAGVLYPSSDDSGETFSTRNAFGVVNSGYNGDNIPATSALLNRPTGIFLDSANNIYIADQLNNLIRKVNSNNNILINIAGISNTEPGWNGDTGMALEVSLNMPTNIIGDSSGHLYVSDFGNSRVRKLSSTCNGIQEKIPRRLQSSDPSVSCIQWYLGLSSQSCDVTCNLVDATCQSSYLTGITNLARFKSVVNITYNLATLQNLVSAADFCNSGINTYLFGTNPSAFSYQLMLTSGIAVTTYCYYPPNLLHATLSCGQAYAYPPAQRFCPCSSPLYCPAPTAFPTLVPTLNPTSLPTNDPTTTPTSNPTSTPSQQPTLTPTSTPSFIPSSIPSAAPTIEPTSIPSTVPSSFPTTSPSPNPTAAPTPMPTTYPTTSPSSTPTSCPSSQPTYTPSSFPSCKPTSSPTIYPTAFPTPQPSSFPTVIPSLNPTAFPSPVPSSTPSALPTNPPTSLPSSQPSVLPSMPPTRSPSSAPSLVPTSSPTCSPTAIPSCSPTFSPTSKPSFTPSSTPSFVPSVVPTPFPTINPIPFPTAYPTSTPSNIPTIVPTSDPTSLPTTNPTAFPTSTSAPTTYNCQNVFSISTYIKSSGNPYNIQLSPFSDQLGSLYISYTLNDEVTYFSSNDGSNQTVAGQFNVAPSSPSSYNGDGGFATSALLNNPYDIVLDSTGNIYIADEMSNKIRFVDGVKDTISTLAGNSGLFQFSGDGGNAYSASLARPIGLHLATSSNLLLIADTYNHRIRQINLATGIITTIVGSGASAPLSGTFGGDNGAATSARLNMPYSVTMDAVGNLYIADTGNNRVRAVDPTTNVITTIAGDGFPGFYDGISATSSSINHPTDVEIDGQGNLIVVDNGNNVISKILLTGAPQQLILVIAGAKSYGGMYIGDGGPANSAGLNSPSSVTIDTSTGDIYISDTKNKAIRKLHNACTSSPSSFPTTPPTPMPSALPTLVPSSTPTSFPSSLPTPLPSTIPTPSPTVHPSSRPSVVPTSAPSPVPSPKPSSNPTPSPSSVPSSVPTSTPTPQPSCLPSAVPTSIPTPSPTSCPTAIPTASPSSNPTPTPSAIPTSSPSSFPTAAPSPFPSCRPSASPTSSPSPQPTSIPTRVPSPSPTQSPSAAPSSKPSSIPTSNPSQIPSSAPSSIPTFFPTPNPTVKLAGPATKNPSAAPSSIPTLSPTNLPSVQPSYNPTLPPTRNPTRAPTTLTPTSSPTVTITSAPTGCPAVPIQISSGCGGTVALRPGGFFGLGHSFVIPGCNSRVNVYLTEIIGIVPITCWNGVQLNYKMQLPDYCTQVPDNNWYPYFSEYSSTTYQSGFITMPDLCFGGLMYIRQQVTFYANFRCSSDSVVYHRFHYGASLGAPWSQLQSYSTKCKSTPTPTMAPTGYSGNSPWWWFPRKNGGGDENDD